MTKRARPDDLQRIPQAPRRQPQYRFECWPALLPEMQEEVRLRLGFVERAALAGTCWAEQAAIHTRDPLLPPWRTIWQSILAKAPSLPAAWYEEMHRVFRSLVVRAQLMTRYPPGALTVQWVSPAFFELEHFTQGFSTVGNVWINLTHGHQKLAVFVQKSLLSKTLFTHWKLCLRRKGMGRVHPNFDGQNTLAIQVFTDAIAQSTEDEQPPH